MARIIRDDVDKFYAYGLNIPTRTIYMGSEEYAEDGETGVDHLMSQRVIKGLHLLDAQSTSAINIIMNNPGGDEYHGLAIFDAIVACQSHVTITVLGMAMSMGSIILQSADERVMSPNSRMMIHYGTWGYYGHAIDSARWNEEGEKFNRWLEDLYLSKMRQKNSRVPKKQVVEMCQFDTFYTAQEAINLGLADKILGESDE